jgi:hypothetical protein
LRCYFDKLGFDNISGLRLFHEKVFIYVSSVAASQSRVLDGWGDGVIQPDGDIRPRAGTRIKHL